MNTPYMAAAPGADHLVQQWPWLAGKLMLAPLPSAADWKQTIGTYLASQEGLSEQMQEAKQQWWSAYSEHTDIAGFVDYWRQCGETAQQLGKRLIDWQMQAVAQWQQQGFALLPQWLNARGDEDRLLLSAASQQSARKQWDEQTEALLQWLSGISPAFLQCLQQWLEAGPQSAAATAAAGSA